MSTFAEVVRSRAGDERIGLLFGEDRWTWAQIVQESADRASVAGRSADRLRVDSENFAVRQQGPPFFVVDIEFVRAGLHPRERLGIKQRLLSCAAVGLHIRAVR